MRYRSQFLIAAAALTIAFVSAAYMKPSTPFITLPPGPPPLTFEERWEGLYSRAPLAVNPLPQIDVPLGLLPSRQMPNPAFGLERGRIAWVAEEHVDALAMPYTGKPPEEWPDARRGITFFSK